MKIYKLYLSKIVLISYAVMFAFVTIFGILVLLSPLMELDFFGPGGPPWTTGIMWLAMLAWVWYAYSRIIFEIKILDDNAIEFRNLFLSITISPKEIQSLKALPVTIGFLRLKHSKGTLHLVNQMDNFHEFVSFIKTSNPNIEIRGC